MARPPLGNDLAIIFKGLRKLGSAATEIQTKEFNKAWANSSLKPLAENLFTVIRDKIPSNYSEIDISKQLSGIFGRLSVVKEGAKAYVSRTVNQSRDDINIPYSVEDVSHISELNLSKILQQKPENNNQATSEKINGTLALEEVYSFENSKFLENLDSMASIPGAATADGLGQIVTSAKHELDIKIEQFETHLDSSKNNNTGITDEQLEAIDKKLQELQGTEHEHDIKVIKFAHSVKHNNNNFIQIDQDQRKYSQEQCGIEQQFVDNTYISSVVSEPLINIVNTPISPIAQPLIKESSIPTKSTLQPPKLIGRKPLAKSKAKSMLSSDAQARKVPQSRLSRLATFGSLAAGLGVGTLAEMTRRTLGVGDRKDSESLLDTSPFLTEANAKRIVSTLCKVRGAALKLGQMLSIQDSSMISPQLQKLFERVRQSADFMPPWQLERTLIKDFGPDWRSLVASFDDKPFAAASIGQVHQALLHDGRSVAMKIQYPGVAEGIESDINNLISTLNVANILPEGLYVDSIIEVAKKELTWECDYEREKACAIKFKNLIKPYPEYYVPEVIDELCTKHIFTTELIEGISVDKCVSLDQESRNYISSLILKLCLMELFQFGYMQTDPNWSNFFYNVETQQLALVDFGACRGYDKEFVDKYINIIHGAATKNREEIFEFSKQLGFLTGYEAKVMVDAHIDAVMILGEAFQEDKPFSFGGQETTRKIQHLVPVMLSHRMCAPPEESYSLHRKMSGAFLLCAKLNGVVNCKPFFDDLWKNYQQGGTWNS